MGVPKFVQEFVSKYPTVFGRLPNRVSSLSIDFNALIHQVAQEVYGYGPKVSLAVKEEIKKTDKKILKSRLMDKITEKISELVMEVKPHDTLILAVDGVVPVAKQWQQRQRRYRAANESTTGESKVSSESKTSKEEPIFDTNLITPGTPLMKEIDTYLTEWLNLNKEKLPPHIIYSSYRSKGEGEHIIMEHFRQLAKKGGLTKDLNHVVLGLDADLIFLSLINPTKNIYLYRNRNDQIVDVQGFREVIIKLLLESPTALDDFLVMSFLIGNDFVPAIPTLSLKDHALNEMIKVYNKLRKNNKSFALTKGEDIIFTNLKDFLTELGLIESDLLAYVFDASVSRPPTLDRELDVFESNWYYQCFKPEMLDKMKKVDDLIFTKQERKDLELYTSETDEVRDPKIVDSSINAMCLYYVKTMFWIYKYYKRGYESVNLYHYYPYFYAPTLNQLGDRVRNYELKDVEMNKGEESIGILHQLLNVLPPSTLKSIFTEEQLKSINTLPYSLLFPKNVVVRSEGLTDRDKHLWLPLVSPISPLINRDLTSGVFDTLSDEEVLDLEFEEMKNIMRQKDFRTDYEKYVNSSSYERSERVSERVSERGRGRGRGASRGRGGFSERNERPYLAEKKEVNERVSERGRGRGRGRGASRGRGRGGRSDQGASRGERVSYDIPLPSLPISTVELKQKAKEEDINELIVKTLNSHPFFTKQKGISSSVPVRLSEFIKDYQSHFLTKGYQELTNHFYRWTTHLGQLKLLSTLIQSWFFLKEQQRIKKAENKPILLVYIGSAPGTNIDILWDLGFNGKILCIDPNFHVFKKKYNKKCYVGLNNEVITQENWDMINGMINEYKEENVIMNYKTIKGTSVGYKNKSLNDFRKANPSFKGKDILNFILNSKDYNHFIYQDYATEELINYIFSQEADCVLGLISDIRLKSGESEYPLDPDVIADQSLQWNILNYFMKSKAKESLMMYSFKFRCPFFILDDKELEAYNKSYVLDKVKNYKHPDTFSDEEVLKDYTHYLRCVALSVKKGEEKPRKLRYIYSVRKDFSNIYFQIFPGQSSSETRIIDNPSEGYENKVIMQKDYEHYMQNYNIMRLYARCDKYKEFVEKNKKLGPCYCWDCSALHQLLEQITLSRKEKEEKKVINWGDDFDKEEEMRVLYTKIVTMLDVSPGWQNKNSHFGLNRTVLHGTQNNLDKIKDYSIWITKGRNEWTEYKFKDNKMISRKFTEKDVITYDEKECKIKISTPVGTIEFQDKDMCEKIKRVYFGILTRLKYMYTDKSKK